jgi:carbamoyl-phosphate synthase small subunit
MRGVIATGDRDRDTLVAMARAVPSMEGADLVRGVTCDAPFEWPLAGMASGDGGYPVETGRRRSSSRLLRVAAYDFGSFMGASYQRMPTSELSPSMNR